MGDRGGSSPFSRTKEINTRKWLSGRASPCQGEGRGFESRLPLHLSYVTSEKTSILTSATSLFGILRSHRTISTPYGRGFLKREEKISFSGLGNLSKAILLYGCSVNGYTGK